ncbi:MAG TPA: hypothetical protein VNM92_15225 [Thermoanaerobaculia bacterium]|nr:hypothetical protein [Thermoanaerobaculia bacterium]
MQALATDPPAVVRWSHRDFGRWLLEVERRFPVATWRIGDVPVWPVVRATLYGSLFNAVVPGFGIGSRSGQHVRRLIRAGTQWAHALGADRVHNEWPQGRADVVFLSYSVGTQPVVAGRCVDPLLTPYVELVKAEGKRARVWETSPFGDYNLPRTTPSALIEPIMLVPRIASQVLPPPPPSDEVLPAFDEFVQFARASGVSFRYAQRKSLRRDIASVRWLGAIFEFLLRRVQPVIGFVADNGLREQAFCLACSRLGVTSVEIQHGVQRELHPAFSYWSAIPSGGYATRPDRFWCWEQADADVINRWTAADGSNAAVAGGDPWLKMWQDRLWGPAAELDAEFSALKEATDAPQHALVALSSVGELFPEALLEVLKNPPSGWRFWIRLHPVNQKACRLEADQVLRQLGYSRSLTDYTTRLPLFLLLRHMDCQIVVNISTVIRQAAAMGVPSIACGDVDQARQFYNTEVSEGLLATANSGDELAALLPAMRRRKLELRRGPRPDSAATMHALLEQAFRRVRGTEQYSRRR